MIDDLITHLRANTDSFTAIEHAWDLEPVEIQRENLPLLYLFPGDESTQGDGTDNLVSKRLTLDVHVYIVCRIETLAARKSELRTAAIGWNAGADTGYDDLELMSGKPISIKGGVIWWEDIYTTWLTLREAY